MVHILIQSVDCNPIHTEFVRDKEDVLDIGHMIVSSSNSCPFYKVHTMGFVVLVPVQSLPMAVVEASNQRKHRSHV